MMNAETEIVVIGAGPAGLTAAYLLAQASQTVTVLEADQHYVGGLSRTIEYKGFRFDIGGHRFFSKSSEVEALWSEILGSDMVERRRLSRIYYKGRFFAYPIQPLEALQKLGTVEALLCVLSYLQARAFPVRHPQSVEDWVCNQFGKRLYRTFFKTYTEKVWGMSCQSISADWAAQRIKGLSLGTAIRSALLGKRRRRIGGAGIKSLIESFRYPRLGPGMMWEKCRTLIEEMGGRVHLGHRVTRCAYDSTRGAWNVTADTGDGTRSFAARHVIASAPMAELAEAIDPPLPHEAMASARALRYRDFITVALILSGAPRLADNWLYIHDPGVKVGRIQNFGAWSPDLVPSPEMSCYGLEYFCFEGDGLWTSTDADLIDLARRELGQLGLAPAGAVVDGCVIRQQKAYPVYDALYVDHVAAVRSALTNDYPGMHLVGRNGMHRYNNQDHAMMTAMLTVRNILAGEERYDVWQVNEDAEYHESGSVASTSGARIVPRSIDNPVAATGPRTL